MILLLQSVNTAPLYTTTLQYYNIYYYNTVILDCNPTAILLSFYTDTLLYTTPINDYIIMILLHSRDSISKSIYKKHL